MSNIPKEAQEKIEAEIHAGIVEKVVETLWHHYKTVGGFTSTATKFIEKITNKKWEREKEKEILSNDLKDSHAENARLIGLLRRQITASLSDRYFSSDIKEVWEEYCKENEIKI